MSIDKVEMMQGNLAELSKDAHKRLRQSIIEHGITYAFSVWFNDGVYYLLDGHARYKTLLLLIEDGFVVPDLPVVLVEAKDRKEAVKKVLIGRSDYHRTTSDGLYEFLSAEKLDLGDITETTNFHSIDFEQFNLEYFGELPDDTDDGDSDDKTECPNCGHRF